VVTISTFTVNFREVSCGDEPGIVRAGSLGVDTVAPTGLVPEDVASPCVTDTLRLPLLLVVFEEEAMRTGAL